MRKPGNKPISSADMALLCQEHPQSSGFFLVCQSSQKAPWEDQAQFYPWLTSLPVHPKDDGYPAYRAQGTGTWWDDEHLEWHPKTGEPLVFSAWDYVLRYHGADRHTAGLVSFYNVNPGSLNVWLLGESRVRPSEPLNRGPNSLLPLPVIPVAGREVQRTSSWPQDT